MEERARMIRTTTQRALQGMMALLAVAIAGSVLDGQNQTPPNVPSPKIELRDRLVGLWKGTSNYEGRFNDGAHQRYSTKESISCLISKGDGPEGLSARCNDSRQITNLDQVSGFRREFDGTFQIKLNGGGGFSGYADGAQKREDDGAWENLPPGGVITGRVSYQLNLDLNWGNGDSVGNVAMTKQ